MKLLLLLLTLIAIPSMAQRSTIPMPKDANNFPLESGLGDTYATSAIVTTTTYDPAQTYQVPSSGNDALRAYRHIAILNRSTSRSVYVCFGASDSCTQNAIIIRPEFGIALDHVLFGKAVGKEYIYFKLDSAGTANVDLSVW